MNINLEFDAASLRRIQQLEGFEIILGRHLILAHEESLRALYSSALGWMQANFQNSTGRLEDAFEQQVHGPSLSELINAEDYAWRRERGFSGMTDSLGRYYPNDPGIAYMANALILERDYVGATFREQVLYALDELRIF